MKQSVTIVATVGLAFLLTVASPRASADFPVPEFTDSHAKRELAENFMQAKNRLRDHHRRSVSPSERIQWRHQRDRLLIDMILAEEELVRGAGGSFTRQEQDALASVFRDYEVIRKALGRGAATDKELARYYSYLEEVRRIEGGLRGSASDTRHAGAMAIFVYRLYMRQLQEYIARRERQVGVGYVEAMQALNRTDRVIGQVWARIRRRGLEDVNRRVRPDVFRLHRPVDLRLRQEVERRLMQALYQETGGRGVIPHRGLGSYEPVPEESALVTPFDEKELQRLLDTGPGMPQQPRITLTKHTFAPGEEMIADYKLPGTFNGQMYVAIIPGATPPSQPSRPGESWMFHRSDYFVRIPRSSDGAGQVSINVPRRSGLYEVRLYDQRTAQVVQMVRIAVR